MSSWPSSTWSKAILLSILALREKTAAKSSLIQYNVFDDSLFSAHLQPYETAISMEGFDGPSQATTPPALVYIWLMSGTWTFFSPKSLWLMQMASTQRMRDLHR